MTRANTNKLKITAIALSLATCLALILGMVFVNPQAARAETTTIDVLEVAFNKTTLGGSLADAFEFEDEEAKTLKVAAGANYTATLTTIWRNGQKQTLWEKDADTLPWSRVENQLIERNVPYCIRVRFSPKTGYALSSKAEVLKQKLKVFGAELGKGKDIELWDIAGQNKITTEIQMDFIISKGMSFIGYPFFIQPIIDAEVSGELTNMAPDTGIWLAGAPGPYTYEANNLPVGMAIDFSNVLGKSICYYAITAVNAMDGGTLYITVTASDGQTCDIPVTIAAVSGGHEHTWSDYGKIDIEHHGYRQCTASDCPGVCVAVDKGSGYEKHDFYPGCNATCKECGDLGNPDAKHAFTYRVYGSDPSYHASCCACGEFEKDERGNVVKEKHSGGTATCLSGAICETCGSEYLAPTGHKFEFRSFSSGGGNYLHLGFCKYCGIEDTSLRHDPKGGTATCKERAKCDYTAPNGDVCGCEYGNYVPHTFEGGVCTQCNADMTIKEIELDIPNYSVGMSYKTLFDPKVIKGNIIGRGEHFYKATRDRDLNETLCNSMDCGEKLIEHNSVMIYKFTPQTNCIFPENLDELNISLTNGELFKKEIVPSGDLSICVLLRVDSDVQSIKLDIPQPIAGCDPKDFIITEKNGLQLTLDNWQNLTEGKFYNGVPTNVDVTVKAPDGKKFPFYDPKNFLNIILKKWLCDLEISGGQLITMVKNAESTEIKMTITLNKAIECPHETTTLKEAGKPETCTEDGVKNKYVCESCGKEFFDAACTLPWNEANAAIPKAHLRLLHEAKPCSEGKDGNIEYYECQRKTCGKLFSDYACNTEITLEDTIIHDFKTEWSANKDNHYHECKNCNETADTAAHRPDRTEATEEYAVKCLDCGYIIAPALAHVTHHTVLVPGEEATCMKDGKKPYYKCSGCEVKFEDAAATKPVSDESSLTIAKAHKFGAWKDEVPPTEETAGVKAHKDCVFCEKHFDENGEEIADLTIAKLVKVEITVIGGTGGGRLTVGDTVTVKAATPEDGKVFAGWTDADGNVVSTDMEYTFTVTEGLSLTATYALAPDGGDKGGETPSGEIKPAAENKGLSGGAIAGIVIACVAAAGIGGFAIVWFAIKKKTFADLISVLKGKGKKE